MLPVSATSQSSCHTFPARICQISLGRQCIIIAGILEVTWKKMPDLENFRIHSSSSVTSVLKLSKRNKNDLEREQNRIANK